MAQSPSPVAESTSLLSWPRRVWIGLARVQCGLVLLLLARWLLDILFLLNVIPLEIRLGWHLHHGGDQEYMYDLARSLAEGVPEESVVGLGQALVMAPWVALLKPEAYIDIVVPLVIINGFILGGLSVLLVGGVARSVGDHLSRQSGGPARAIVDRVALIAAGIWAMLPLVAYFSFFWHPREAVMRSAAAPKLAWLNGLSDGPAVFFLLLATFLLARALQRRAGFWRMLGTGAALGAAITFRFHVVPMAMALLVYVAVAYGWRSLLTALGGGLIAYLPQAWYNLAVFNFPFTTGYVSFSDMQNYGGTFRRSPADFLTNVPYYPDQIWASLVAAWGRMPWLFVLAGLALIACGVGLVWVLRRADWRPLALLIAAPLVYLLPMMAAFNFGEDVIRFTMPALPSLMVAALLGIAVLPSWVRSSPPRREENAALPEGPADAGSRRRLTLVAAGLVIAYAAIYVLTNPLISSTKAERERLFNETEVQACERRAADLASGDEPDLLRDQETARRAIDTIAEDNHITQRRLIVIIIRACLDGSGEPACGETAQPLVCGFSQNTFAP